MLDAVPVSNGSTKHLNQDIQTVVVLVPLADIAVSPEWNSRSGNWKEASGAASETASDFSDFKKSFEARGQDSPIDVRPNPDKRGPKYALVSGFRRVAALEELAKAGAAVPNLPGWTPKAPVVRAVVREVSELEAVELNIRENTAREPLRPADLCWGIGRLSDGGLETGEIAERLGKNLGYVSTLRTIYRNAKHCVVLWRESEVPVSVGEMVQVAKEPTPAEQLDLYKRYLKGRHEPTNTRAKRGLAWLKKAQGDAAQVGFILGTLSREGYVKDPVRWTEKLLRHVVVFKDWDAEGKNGPTDKQVDSIVDSARRAFQEARDDEGEEEEETGE